MENESYQLQVAPILEQDRFLRRKAQTHGSHRGQCEGFYSAPKRETETLHELHELIRFNNDDDNVHVGMFTRLA